MFVMLNVPTSFPGFSPTRPYGARGTKGRGTSRRETWERVCLAFTFADFSHVAGSHANLLRQKKEFAQEKSSTPKRLVWDIKMADVTSLDVLHTTEEWAQLLTAKVSGTICMDKSLFF